VLTIVSRMATDLGARIRELREARNWSQRQLEERASLGNGYISLVEAGERVPKPATLKKIAEAFRLTEKELTEDEDSAESVASADPQMSELQLNALAIRKLDPQEFELLMKQLAERREFIEKRYLEERRRRRGKRNRPSSDQQPRPDNS